MSRFLPDRFTMMLVATVILASLLPISGEPAHYFSIATKCAIALLFFLHGARCRETSWWRACCIGACTSSFLLVTFGIFPLLGLAVGYIPDSILPQPLYMGVLFLCVLPSTVQSSIAFTSMAGGNVPAAICAASASNIFGMFLTPLLVGFLFTVGGHGGGFRSMRSARSSCSFCCPSSPARHCSPGLASGYAPARRCWPLSIAARS